MRGFLTFARPTALVAALAVVSALVLVGSLGCTKASSPGSAPVVQSIQVHELETTPRAAYKIAALKAQKLNSAHSTSRGLRTAGELKAPFAEPAIQGDVTFTKSEIFGRMFLYGSDLQYSSIGDTKLSLVLQSMAVGHIPARFMQVGDRLQLTADQAYLFQSDINKPGRLIHEWPIVKEDAATLTVSMREASSTLPTVVSGPKAPLARQSWVRSVEFIAQGNYLLIETSIELADGTIAEFMESTFPRDTLVPANTPVLLADPELEPLADRYGLLGGDPLFVDLPVKGRTRTLVASRFPTPAVGQTIDWYVTPNAPAIYMNVLKSGVEGWNRYSQKMWGRDFVSFKGVLPLGVKIGDPRYNVINWDSIPAAGAAYESQASDPFTGLQSHSLVYLPYAWVKIGEEFWKRGGLSQDETLAPALQAIMSASSILGEKNHVRCFHDIEMSASLEARTSPEVFARELLKNVLFHEVGHAMGLAHNFKGSLIWDANDPKSPSTTSIMDYNQYQLEGAAFDSELSSTGALLEYDRQIISVLYNGGKDVVKADAVLPACADDEADDFSGGVDPLCLRYDAGQDPTQTLVQTIELLKDPAARLGNTRALSLAMLDAKVALGDAATVVTEADLDARIAALVAQARGLTTYYYFSGAQSLTNMAKVNVKSLYIARAPLPVPYDARAMLDRSFNGISYSVSTLNLEPATVASLATITNDTLAWIKTTPWYTGLPALDAEAAAVKKLKSVQSIQAVVEAADLPRVRASIIGVLVYKESAPFQFSTGAGATDVEKGVMDLLERVIVEKVAGKSRGLAERAAAVTSLKTFTPVPGSDVTFSRIAAIVSAEVAAAKTAQERQGLRQLLRLIQAK